MPNNKRKRARRYVSNKKVHTVETVYYGDYEGRTVVKNNSSKYALNAAANAYKHLKKTTYFGAVLAEVYDLINGVTYAVLKLELDGSINIIHSQFSDKRDLEDSTYFHQLKANKR